MELALNLVSVWGCIVSAFFSRLALLFSLLLPLVCAHGQGTGAAAGWKIEMRQVRLPVANGDCGPLELTIRDQSGQPPVTPDGKQLHWQDFEFTLTKGAGPLRLSGSGNILCASSPGATGIVTVTYPESGYLKSPNGQGRTGKRLIPNATAVATFEVRSAGTAPAGVASTVPPPAPPPPPISPAPPAPTTTTVPPPPDVAGTARPYPGTATPIATTVPPPPVAGTATPYPAPGTVEASVATTPPPVIGTATPYPGATTPITTTVQSPDAPGTTAPASPQVTGTATPMPTATTSTLQIKPTPRVPWLSMNNGPGGETTSWVHYCANMAGTVWEGTDGYGADRMALCLAGKETEPLWETLFQFVGLLGYPGCRDYARFDYNGACRGQEVVPNWAPEATFVDPALQQIRSILCAQHPIDITKKGCLVRRIWYPATTDWQEMANEWWQGRDMPGGPIALSVIFLKFGVPRFVAYGRDSSDYHPTSTAQYDSHGPKNTPNACLACHGGRMEPSGETPGATLLPLDPQHYIFPTVPGHTRADQEETIREINALVFSATSKPAVREYINLLYGGQVQTPGTRARDDVTPAGWAEQRGLYQQIVRPYCASCHMAQDGDLALNSWGAMQRLKDRVRATVCDGTMPHSEATFNGFWNDPGPIKKNGVLLTSLGFQGC